MSLKMKLGRIGLLVVLLILLAVSPSAGVPLPQEIGQAVADGGTATIASWLKSGSNIDAQDEYGQTMLYNSASVIVFLLDHDAKVNLATNNGVNPLHRVCYRGNSDIIRILVEAGVTFALRRGTV